MVGDASSKAITAAFNMLAELEKDLTAARIKEGLALRKKDGVILGRPKGSTSSSKLDSKYGHYMAGLMPTFLEFCRRSGSIFFRHMPLIIGVAL